ncbi:MAG: hypothetical protein P8184_12375 [Calditrichia bacterium]
MSERFQKSFISAREFVESWDKELYELNNLDFFIYLTINRLGNQLEKRFFVQDKVKSTLFLDFEHMGTVCFNIGDSLEFFLEENCLGSCPLNCPRNLEGRVDVDKAQVADNIKRKLRILQSFMAGQLDKEQCLRMDLMNHVILDTLLQFYNEELELEIKENDPDLLELAEFMEEVLIEFIRFEGQTLLSRPFEIALNYFEELLQTEADEESNAEWFDEDKGWESEEDSEDWQRPNEEITEIFTNFVSDEHYNPGQSGSALMHDIKFLNVYLKEHAHIKNIRELNEHHLAEFFSVWLVQELYLSDEKQIPFIFRATARFITYLYHHYNINLKKDFLKYYQKLKTDLPRVIEASHLFLDDYNLLDILLTPENGEGEERTGFFEITQIHDRGSRKVDLREINLFEQLNETVINSAAFSKLKKGDIIHAGVLKKEGGWEVLEIQFVYPALAKEYLG